jgi:hypothetical protein
VWLSAQTVRSNSQFHVSGQQLPATLTSPTPIEGRALTTRVSVDFMVIANTGSSVRHVTVEDCTATTPFILYNAYPIPALTAWLTPLGNTSFGGCFKWSADSTDVMGTVTGTR